MKDNTYQYYAGSMVYKNDKTLNYLLTPEGMVTKTSSVFTYEYHLKDHLGNTRVTFQPNGTGTTLTQATEYYPFGMNYPQSPGGTNKYLYNGKEKQDDVLSLTALDMYDYGARFYDPMIGRWHVVDPSCEEANQEVFSPYCYVGNNPISHNDPDGKILNNIIGGIVGGAVEIGFQLATKGEVTSWTNVGISAVAGAATSGASAVRSVLVNGTAALASSAVNYVDDNGSISSGADALNVVRNAAVDMAVDKVGGKIAKVTGGKIAKEAIQKAADKT